MVDDGFIGLVSFFASYRESWEQFPEADQLACNIASCDDERYGYDNHHQSEAFSDCQAFSKDGYSEEDGCHGLQCAENGGRGGADILDGTGSAEEGYGGGEDSQCKQIGPQIPLVRCVQYAGIEQACHKKR